MKRGKKNNPFTAALGEELTTRKVLEKAKDREEDRILMATMDEDFKAEIIAEPIDSTKPIPQVEVDAKVVPISQSKKAKKSVAKKISAEKKVAKKIPAVEEKKSASIKIEAENDFEKRIFAEADNDFFDEKIPQNIGENMRSKVTEKIKDTEEKKSPQSSFRSKYIQKQFADAETADAENETSPDFDPELNRKLTRAEIAGVGLSAAMLIYAFVNLDKPLFFLALSLFTHLMRPLIGSLCGKYNRKVQNAMRSFSIVVFIGSLVILFTMR